MQNFMKSDYFTFQGKKPLVKKALFLLGLLLVSVAQTLSAQNTFTYSGLVKAENGDALPGVNVVEKEPLTAQSPISTALSRSQLPKHHPHSHFRWLVMKPLKVQLNRVLKPPSS